jgi:excisionase family DNA binding protein
MTTTEAAKLLKVSPRTILNWINEGTIPYIQLPSGGNRPQYRIPLQGLISSLAGNYDLANELIELEEHMRAAGTADAIDAVLADE